MKQRVILIALGCWVMAGCSVEPGSTKWCEAKKEQPKLEWSMDDAATFARHCLLDSSTVGSEAWCEDLKATPKGDWTADDAANYARHCVM